MTLGEVVNCYITEHGISQRQFAKRCGMSNGYISMIINGINPRSNEPIVPSLKTLKSVAHGMGISLDDLLVQIDDTLIELKFDKAPKSRTEEFVELFTKLSADQQTLIIAQIKGILASQPSEPVQKIWLAASSSDDQAPSIVEASKAKVKAAQDDHTLKNEEDL